MTNPRLTAENLHGIWAGVTMAWDANDQFDEEIYATNIRRTIDANVHGIYTTGSTGEFYAVDDDEFRRMVDIQAELCGAAGMPLQIGCCSDATHKTLRLLEYVASRPEVGAAQVVIPYWMELDDRELYQFFQDLYQACPDLPLVHYNIPRSKRFLSGEDYRRLLDVAPSLIGVKFTTAGTYFSALQASIQTVPELSYFVGEGLLASGMQLGARGCYSSLVATNPAFTLEMYEKSAAGKWEQAIAMQNQATQFFAEAETFVEARGEGVCDPVFDKGLSVASGCLVGHQRCRAPYLGWSDDTVQALREWLKKNYPQFIYPE